MNHSDCRIYGIMAREAPICILFRRGPSKWTQLVRWNTKTDSFLAGSWFHGHIYERRCDVSPNGKYLIYFAMNKTAKSLADLEGYTYAWTAISKPPKYTAIVLWPKGDCWHGGGLFVSDREVWLNHRPDAAVMHPKHTSRQFAVTINANAYGEDEPIYNRRLERDGWECIQPGEFVYKYGMHQTEQTEIWEKCGRSGKKLRRELLEIDFKTHGGPYVEAFSLIQKQGDPIPLPGASWADLDQNGKVAFARAGKIYRATLARGELKQTELIDLNLNSRPADIGT